MKLPKIADVIVNSLEKLTPRGLLLLSAAAGLLTCALIYMVLSNVKPDAKVEDKPDLTMVKVVSAKADIPERTELKEEFLRVMEVPQAAVPEDAVKEMSEVLGKPTRTKIYSGDILTGRKVFPDQKEAGFPGIIPSDCRAVSLQIDDVTGVAGFALPGDYVDVMLVSEKLQDGRVTGEVVMQNVLLLSINKIAEPVAAGGGEKDKEKKSSRIPAIDNPATATLAVHPEEVIRLTVAAQVGKVYLALRPFRPSNRYITDTTYALDLSRGNPTPTPAPTPAPAPAYTPPASAPSQYYEPAASSGIQVIRGTQVSR